MLDVTESPHESESHIVDALPGGGCSYEWSGRDQDGGLADGAITLSSRLSVSMVEIIASGSEGAGWWAGSWVRSCSLVPTDGAI